MNYRHGDCKAYRQNNTKRGRGLIPIKTYTQINGGQ